MGSLKYNGVFGKGSFLKTFWAFLYAVPILFAQIWAICQHYEVFGLATRVYVEIVIVSGVIFMGFLTMLPSWFLITKPASKALGGKNQLDPKQRKKALNALAVSSDLRISICIGSVLFISILVLELPSFIMTFPHGHQGETVGDLAVNILLDTYDSGYVTRYIGEKLTNFALFWASTITLAALLVPWTYFARSFVGYSVGEVKMMAAPAPVGASLNKQYQNVNLLNQEIGA
jgi:hypothetical protein